MIENYVRDIERKLCSNERLTDKEIRTVIAALRESKHCLQEPYYEVVYHDTSRIEEIVRMIKKEDKHDCCLWDFGRHECGIGISDCPDSSACGFFD